MKLSIEQAREITRLFGPCSFVYETTEPAELIAEAVGFETLAAFLDDQIQIESLRWEQRGNQWSGENEVEFRAEVAEDDNLITGIKERVAGYLAVHTA